MFGPLGIQELIIVGAVAVILFGKRLPEVARSLGGTYRDFRRSLSEIQSQFNFNDTYHRPTSRSEPSSSYATGYTAEESDDYDRPTAPQFELPSPPEPAAEASSERTENSVN
jgi:sec-independent protein translocase protein TatA